MNRLIVGCGYLGRRVADLWHRAGDTVHVVTRTQAHASEFASSGWHPQVADVMQPTSLVDLPKVDTLLFAVGYDRSCSASIHEVYVEGLRNVLDAISASAKKVIYISSTGVYAEADGGWVDETSAVAGNREGTQACLAAEQLLQSHALGKEATILRLAGIYGPGRLPRAGDLLAHRPIPAPAAGYLNLIHVKDAARSVVAAAGRGSGGIYSVADGMPALRRDYLEELARLLDAPRPQFEPPAEPPSGRRASNKRVRNDRLINELGLDLQYPSYREGLSAIVREMDGLG